jgi:hypothetical protein
MSYCPSCLVLVELKNPQKIIESDEPWIEGTCASCGKLIRSPGEEPDEPPPIPQPSTPISLPPNLMIGPFGAVQGASPTVTLQSQAKPCYNCLRPISVFDGVKWSSPPHLAQFGGNTIQLATIGNPPMKVWVCPACGRCVICGLRGSKGVTLISERLNFKNHIITLVYYCKDHEKMAKESNGVPYQRVSEHLKESWLNYLADQSDNLSTVNTPQSRQRLESVKGLMEQLRK